MLRNSIPIAIALALALGVGLGGCADEEEDYTEAPQIEREPAFGGEPPVAAGREPAPPAPAPGPMGTEPEADVGMEERDEYFGQVQQQLASLEERAEALSRDDAEQQGEQAAAEVEQQIQSLRSEVEELQLDERWQESTDAIQTRLEEIERSLRQREQT